MDATPIPALVATLAAVERGVGDEAALTAVLDAGAKVRSFVEACEQIATRSLAALAREGRAAPVTETLRERGRTAAEARAAAARAAACEQHPGLHDLLAAGAISTGHVDAFNKATAGLSDIGRANLADRVDDLVSHASEQTAEAFGKTCRDAAREASEDDGLSLLERQRSQRDVKRWIDRDTGMHHTKLSLDPVTDEALWQTINATIRQAAASGTNDGHSWAHRSVDTLVALITRHDRAPSTPAPATADVTMSLFNRDDDHLDTDRAVSSPTSTPTASADGLGRWCAPAKVPEINILIDWTLLADTAAAHGLCETRDGEPLPVATVRRLCCDADLLPIVLAGDGRPLDVGHARRLATIDQRRALAAMYTTCGYPDCTVPLTHCSAHHVTDWTRHRGATDLDNLLPVCSAHHHQIHEGGWTLTMTPDRRVTSPAPTATSSTTRSTPPPAAASAPSRQPTPKPQPPDGAPAPPTKHPARRSPARRRPAEHRCRDRRSRRALVSVPRRADHRRQGCRRAGPPPTQRGRAALRRQPRHRDGNAGPPPMP